MAQAAKNRLLESLPNANPMERDALVCGTLHALYSEQLKLGPASEAPAAIVDKDGRLLELTVLGSVLSHSIRLETPIGLMKAQRSTTMALRASY